MAIAFEFDFRGTPAPGAPDTGARAVPGKDSGKEQGGEFAAALLRARGEIAGEEPTPAPLPGFAGFAPQLLLEPEASKLADADIAIDASEDIPGELELDRELSIAREAEMQIGRPADIAAAPASRLNAAVLASTDVSQLAAEVPALTKGDIVPAPAPAAATLEVQHSPAEAHAAEASAISAPAEIDLIEAALPVAAPIAAKSDAKDNPGTAEVKAEKPVPAASAEAAPPVRQAADPLAPEDFRLDRVIMAVAPAGDKTAAADAQPASTSSVSPLTFAAAALASSPAALQTPAPITMAPAHGVVVASPVEVVNIVAQTAKDGQSDRVVVQLDPPELGRVSIDFKFDSQGLQHVTITGETPEALRQLRAMHFELVQALERQGFDGQNMTFQHQQQNGQQAANAEILKQLQSGPGAKAAAGSPAAPQVAATGPVSADGRLDIRV